MVQLVVEAGSLTAATVIANVILFLGFPHLPYYHVCSAIMANDHDALALCVTTTSKELDGDQRVAQASYGLYGLMLM